MGLTIPAQICTDDRTKWAKFDASDWFTIASVEGIIDLAQHGWTSREEAADIARSANAESPEVADLLQYLMFLRHGGSDGGCTCTVDRVAALEWLAHYRPEVLALVRPPRLVA